MIAWITKWVRRVMLLAVFTAIAYGAVEWEKWWRDEIKHTKVIHTDYGGAMGEYIEKYELWRDRGRQVRIDGVCISACTLAIGLIKENHLCATPNGKLAFHSAHSVAAGHRQFSSEGTRLMWYIYPEPVRAYLRQKNFDAEVPGKAEHPALIYLEGDDVYKFVRRCG